MPNPTTKTRQAIKNRFVRNAIPTQADFADLIDASLNQADDGLLKLPNEPLGLVRQQPDKPVLRFYDSPDATESAWQIYFNADNKAGFALANVDKDGATSTRLFLDAVTGNVGIGTTKADAKLTVQGGMQIADTVTIGGRVDILTASNPIRFSSTWTGFPDDKTNGAEISNDVANYKTLMIVGNKSAGGPRSVSIWDVLNVNGSLNVKSTLTATGNVGIGTDVPGSKLHIVHSNQDPGGNTLILGPTNQSNLRLGYDAAYSWIQSHGLKPLAINSIGNNVGIGTTNPAARLQITGNVSITSAEGQNYACKSNYMAPGSLTIGGIDRNYGGGNNWNSSTAGLLLEALDNTEIAIHDSGTRLASFMYYEGAKNQFTIGRDMGWGAISAVNVQGSLQVNGQTNILTGSNPVRFSSNWTGFPDDKTNGAEISNDTGGHKTLMIVGNRSNGGGRRVSIWDILEVNGTCMANGSFQVNNNGNAFKIDTLADRAIFTLSKAFHGPGRQISWDGDNNWDQYSDETLKTNIHIETGILPRLLQIDVKSFQWKDDLESNKRQLGFIAQDVRLAFPNLIKEKPFGEQRLMSLNYTNFGILAVGAIKELNAIMATEIQELRVELDRLKQQVGD
jgi:hypothetical protein